MMNINMEVIMAKKKGKKLPPSAYSAKKAAAGKDIGKKNVPGKSGFKAVAAKAAAEYGSKAAGERVAGAALAKMRGKRK